MNRKTLSLVLPVAAGLALGGLTLTPLPGVAQTANQQALAVRSSPIQPLSQQLQLNREKVVLGEKLFFDPRLSRDNTISCASCHDIAAGGADAIDFSVGIGGARTTVNSPTVLNSGLNFAQFWDGRAETLEEQIDGPVHHPGEMGSNWQEVLSKLRTVPEYVAAFDRIYPGGMQIQNVKDAIATYERSLITPNARFDRYLNGDNAAINEEERAGYELFSSLGCVSCHQGRGVGGNMFQRFGVVGNYFKDRGNITQADYGRYNVTGDDDDLHVFKVPSLRNVELTAPYLHDGSAETLEAVVQIMARYQIGQELQDREVSQIVAFLKTLTGELEAQGNE
ncbi:MAG: cytochrome-c peroxidase [Kiloniellales bacterium]|nr:cytochrome-c peroxidase [Kiloniellales bacterium]